MANKLDNYRGVLDDFCQRFDLIYWDLGDGRSYGIAHRQDVLDAANGDPAKAAEGLFSVDQHRATKGLTDG